MIASLFIGFQSVNYSICSAFSIISIRKNNAGSLSVAEISLSSGKRS